MLVKVGCYTDLTCLTEALVHPCQQAWLRLGR